MIDRTDSSPPALFDVHTHVGLDVGFFLRGWSPYAATAQQLLDEMDRNGIQYAVCFPFTLPTAFDAMKFRGKTESTCSPGRFPFDLENELLLREVDRLGASDRLSVFAMFDPGRKVEQQLASLRRMAGRIAGLKSQTTILRSPVRSLCSEAAPLMHFAAENNLPVVLHTSVNDVWAHVNDCLDVAAAHPEFASTLRIRCDSIGRCSNGQPDGQRVGGLFGSHHPLRAGPIQLAGRGGAVSSRSLQLHGSGSCPD